MTNKQFIEQEQRPDVAIKAAQEKTGIVPGTLVRGRCTEARLRIEFRAERVKLTGGANV